MSITNYISLAILAMGSLVSAQCGQCKGGVQYCFGRDKPSSARQVPHGPTSQGSQEVAEIALTGHWQRKLAANANSATNTALERASSSKSGADYPYKFERDNPTFTSARLLTTGSSHHGPTSSQGFWAREVGGNCCDRAYVSTELDYRWSADHSTTNLFRATWFSLRKDYAMFRDTYCGDKEVVGK
ncbi:hypothetical protein BST61_g311 [Cercospora zeina]